LRPYEQYLKYSCACFPHGAPHSGQSSARCVAGQRKIFLFSAYGKYAIPQYAKESFGLYGVTLDRRRCALSQRPLFGELCVLPSWSSAYILKASPNPPTCTLQTVFLACALAALRAGIRIANSSAIIAITTNNSIKVNPVRKLQCRFRTSVSPCLSGNLPLFRLGILISNGVKAFCFFIMLPPEKSILRRVFLWCLLNYHFNYCHFLLLALCPFYLPLLSWVVCPPSAAISLSPLFQLLRLYCSLLVMDS